MTTRDCWEIRIHDLEAFVTHHCTFCSFQVNKINKHRTYCKNYALVRETEATREHVVCGGEVREKVEFISAGSTVEITMQTFTSLKRKDSVHFLLKYEGKFKII